MKLLLLLSLALASTAHAELRESLGIGLTPFTKAPSNIPTAFDTPGYTLTAAVYFFADSGITGSYVSSGTADVFAVCYRYYFVGEPQTVSKDLSALPADRAKEPMVMNRKQWGFFGEAGVGMYKATNLQYAAGASTVTSGFTAAAAVGGEYPIFGRVSGEMRLGMFNTGTSAFSAIYGELGLSFAFSI